MCRGGWGKFCRQRSLELSRADWVAGLFGALVRSVSFAKSSQERDLAMCLEHAFFLLIAVVIGERVIHEPARHDAGVPSAVIITAA